MMMEQVSNDVQSAERRSNADIIGKMQADLDAYESLCHGKDAEIAALNQQLVAARNEALEEAASIMAPVWGIGCAAAIRALASHPAAPVQPVSIGDLLMPKAGREAIAGKSAVFAVDILGNPMREYAPNKWENCVWPSDAAPVQPVWQSMGTAPRDGTEIILRYPLQGNVKKLVSFNAIHGQWESKGEACFPESQQCEWAIIPVDTATHAAPPVQQPEDEDFDALLYPPKAMLKREDWDVITRKPKVAPPVQQTGDVREALAAAERDAADFQRVCDAVADALKGNYYCGRVWSAWSVGTMGEDDFTPSEEVDEVVSEIAAAAIAACQPALATTRPSAALTDAQIMRMAGDMKQRNAGVWPGDVAFARAILAASGGALAVPDGYVVAPKEPTQEMLDNIAAFYTGCSDHAASLIYRAMIAAAPTTQDQGGDK